ncbi:MAG: hypothetical protein SGJ20_09095 [Planctomycetota bacterium]|nr:hypothetical protein [Planctomycetota bacterium]
MDRPRWLDWSAIIVVASVSIGVLGCQAPPAPFDPFMTGNTTIAPPGTALPTASPYYGTGVSAPVVTQGAPGAPGFGPGTVAPPTAVAPAPAATVAPEIPIKRNAQGYLPSGGFSIPQSSTSAINTPGLANAPPPNTYYDPRLRALVTNPTSTDSLIPSHSPLPAVLQTSGSSASGATSNAVFQTPAPAAVDRYVRPKSLDRNSGLPEISDLPMAATVSSAPLNSSANFQPNVSNVPLLNGGVATTTVANSQFDSSQAVWQGTDNRVQLTSGAGAGGSIAAKSEPGGTYNHDAGYRTLQGKLDYLQSCGIWKLRYIPVDGQTDDYGGSVVLSDKSRLNGFSSGDFVTVQGRLTGATTQSQDYSVPYQIDQIQKQ